MPPRPELFQVTYLQAIGMNTVFAYSAHRFRSFCFQSMPIFL